MGARRRIYRYGFLITFFILTITIYAQDTGSSVSVTVNPQRLIVNNPFTLSFLVDYPVPGNVSFVAPQIPDFIVIDRLIKMPKTAENGQVQTSIEFSLIASESGRITLEPFLIETTLGITETNPLVLEIHAENRNFVTTVRFVWEGVPQEMPAGERITFTLRVNTQRSGDVPSQLPPPAFFMPEVPQGVILSRSQLSSQEIENGNVLKLMLIPLEAGSFFLPARILLFGEMRYEIPALRIRLTGR